MILNVKGELNEYYAQTLCMLFFPGERYLREGDEKVRADECRAEIEVCDEPNGDVTARASFSSPRFGVGSGEGSCAASETEEDDRRRKIAAGRAVYAAGRELFGVVPPWGILTGVRPSKIATEYLRAGNGVYETRRILRDEYLVDRTKAALVTSVARAEARLTDHLPDDMCSIYISIPFCPSRCAYCSFVSYTSSKLLSLIDGYLESILAEIDGVCSVIRELGLRVASVYIGGGTPSTLSAEQISSLLDRINANIDVASLLEFTLEAGRPDTITPEKLAAAAAGGVTRISVNPQTLSDEVLRAIGRDHTVEDFFRAYEMARASGIRTLNVDLIAGLPGDTVESFKSTYDRIVELDPENITLHTFCVKRAADMAKYGEEVYDPRNDSVARCVEYARKVSMRGGYIPYYMYRQKNTVGNLENVGYSKKGHEGLYNIFMMEELHSIFGVGAGAVTKFVSSVKEDGARRKIERIFSPKYPYEYLRDDRAGAIALLREKGKAFFWY